LREELAQRFRKAREGVADEGDATEPATSRGEARI
jgi:hypothetical protein